MTMKKDERGRFANALCERFPNLLCHALGTGTGGWDLGFFVSGADKDDRRSSEFIGDDGVVHAKIVENYVDWAKNEPRRIIDFGRGDFQDDVLPAHVIRAAETMLEARSG